MDVKFCENKNEWNNFILQNSGSFLQSFEWGEFQKNFGKEVLRIQIFENNEILAQAQIIKEKSAFINYFYLPYGPIFKKNISRTQKEKTVSFLLNKLAETARQENRVFLRVEPMFDLEKFDAKTVALAKRNQPQKTLVLDLSKTKEELLKDFNQSTRHNIQLAKKYGVEIKKDTGRLADFYRLLSKTKERQEFGIFPENHYKKILQFQENLKSELFFAEYECKMINATLVVFFGKRATTLHSGSDYNFKHLKGANLLRWEIILASKSKGFTECDFWGIDEKKWPGVTAFKKGFGGKEVEYPAGFDLVFRGFWYNIYKAGLFIKKLKTW